MDARQENEWCRAQNGPLLLAAVRRYVKYWLPLLAELDGYSASWIPLVPPLECGWIWHCHRLNPVAYEKDCQRLFGRVLDPPFIDAPMKEIAVDGSAYIWDKRYPGHPYRLDPKDYLGLSDADVCCEKTPFEVELEQAVYNQKKFYHQVCEPHMIDDQYLKHAVERYKAFLYLIEKCSRELNMHCPLLVPTCDIELIWHTHQLKVEAYREDMIKVVGRVLHLDGTSEGMSMRQRLDEGFKQTQDLWEKIFGFTYERAGATYKCYKSNPLPTPNLPFTHQPTLQGSQRVLSLQCQQEGYLKKRIIMEVCLAILGGRHIPIKSDQNFFVRVKLLRKWADFKVDTIEKSNSTNAINWKQSWIIECEIATNGLTLELRSRPKHFLMGKVQSSKLIGSSTLEWKKLLESPMLHMNKWVVAIPLDFPKDQKDIQPMFHVVATSTPTKVGPYLLKMVHARPTDDNGETLQPGFQQRGGWISRTIIDHAREEIFVARIKFFEGVLHPQLVRENEKVIHIHRGGWRYNAHYPIEAKHGRVPGDIIGSAQQLTNSNCDQYVLHSMRQWSLFNGDATLTIKRSSQLIEIQGNLGYPMTLYRGRRLQYQVEEGSNNDDMSFVTIVRFFPNAPLGRATALFNWRTGEIEVSEEENVVLVILLMATIGVSIYDMMGDVIGEQTKHQKSITLDSNELGCLVVNKRYWYTKNIEENHDMILGGMIREDQRTMKQKNGPNDTNSLEGNSSDQIEATFGLIGATLEIIGNIIDS
ncbi:hypothetical protein SUGI_0067860 [Cryptomeria japonica]|nr:hypothetical protein SUGI_0067860 [Cryptomeria japonica]